MAGKVSIPVRANGGSTQNNCYMIIPLTKTNNVSNFGDVDEYLLLSVGREYDCLRQRIQCTIKIVREPR